MRKKEDTGYIPPENTNNRLIPLTEWPKYHVWPPIGGLRHMVFMAPNGSEKVFIRVGRRILISEKEFFKWIATEPKIIPGKKRRKQIEQRNTM